MRLKNIQRSNFDRNRSLRQRAYKIVSEYDQEIPQSQTIHGHLSNVIGLLCVILAMYATSGRVWRVCEFAQAALKHPLETLSRPTDECVIENDLSYFSIETYVMGTQKNRLNEPVLLSTSNIYV